ncbi:MAG TPA: hypothetical protein VHS99_07425 [Chloroflexota bacterium]|nr:hypothetical protein [Chloroflexota bacterium]
MAEGGLRKPLLWRRRGAGVLAAVLLGLGATRALPVHGAPLTGLPDVWCGVLSPGWRRS